MEWRGQQEMGLVKCLSCARRAVSGQKPLMALEMGFSRLCPLRNGWGCGAFPWIREIPTSFSEEQQSGSLAYLTTKSSHLLFPLLGVALPSSRATAPSCSAVTWRLHSFPSAAEFPLVSLRLAASLHLESFLGCDCNPHPRAHF